MVFHSTVLFVSNTQVSKEFYTRFLGFTIVHDFGANVILSNGLTLWEISADHLINKQLKTRHESNRHELYFEDENIDKVYEMLKNRAEQYNAAVHRLEKLEKEGSVYVIRPENKLEVSRLENKPHKTAKVYAEAMDLAHKKLSHFKEWLNQ